MINKHPFGSWISPISTKLIVTDAIGIDEIQCVQNNVYWVEKRPTDNGRSVIVQHNSHIQTDCIPAGYSARSMAHEYGGASYCVTSDGIYFINSTDQQIYRTHIDSEPQAITALQNCRFTNMVFDDHNDQIICICEDHNNSNTEATNTLVAINIDNGIKTILAQGYDFYSNPTFNKATNQLAWLCWNHPNMPWDGTELWLADISVNRLANTEHIAGGNDVSICQPQWSPDNILTFVSDENGWWNLYQFQHGTQHCLHVMEAEFAVPQWVFGQSSYQYVTNNTIHCIVTHNTVDTLMQLDIHKQTLTAIPSALTTLSSLHCSADFTCLIGSSSTCPPQITKINHSDYSHETLKASYTIAIDSAYISIGRHINFTTRHNDTVHAIYYPPTNKDYTSNALPPLIVLSHGGPTANCSDAFDIRKQYWTSRGFALLDVNYSGSTGFGRAYRQRLNYQWGIRDVEDCCDAALYAVEHKLANPEQLLIKGGSAGGYSVLCALTFHNVFSAGASYYGIGELETLATDTHKFESRYLDNLVGAYPEEKQTYIDRSPIHHVNQLNCPVIFFQGEDDFVVPKQQAEKMVAAIDAKGLPVSYLLFEGEGHGFRKAETIEDTLNAEYLFYATIFKFEITEPLKPIAIKNLEALQQH